MFLNYSRACEERAYHAHIRRFRKVRTAGLSLTCRAAWFSARVARCCSQSVLPRITARVRLGAPDLSGIPDPHAVRDGPLLREWLLSASSVLPLSCIIIKPCPRPKGSPAPRHPGPLRAPARLIQPLGAQASRLHYSPCGLRRSSWADPFQVRTPHSQPPHQRYSTLKSPAFREHLIVGCRFHQKRHLGHVQCHSVWRAASRIGAGHCDGIARAKEHRKSLELRSELQRFSHRAFRLYVVQRPPPKPLAAVPGTNVERQGDRPGREPVGGRGYSRTLRPLPRLQSA